MQRADLQFKVWICCIKIHLFIPFFSIQIMDSLEPSYSKGHLGSLTVHNYTAVVKVDLRSHWKSPACRYSCHQTCRYSTTCLNQSVSKGKWSNKFVKVEERFLQRKMSPLPRNKCFYWQFKLSDLMKILYKFLHKEHKLPSL